MTAIYNTLGDNYDTTRKADPEITATLAKLLNLQNEKHYLDIACGTEKIVSQVPPIYSSSASCGTITKSIPVK